MIPAYRVLAQRIRDDLGLLENSVQRVYRAWELISVPGIQKDMFVDSAALNLHAFYSGAEKLFEMIAEQLDQSRPKGENWHLELLRQMTVDLGNLRPPVVDREMVASLDEYRRFRHVVRNVYAEHLDPQRFATLVKNLPRTWEQLNSQLVAFANVLEGVSEADDA